MDNNDGTKRCKNLVPLDSRANFVYIVYRPNIEGARDRLHM